MDQIYNQVMFFNGSVRQTNSKLRMKTTVGVWIEVRQVIVIAFKIALYILF